MMRTTRSRSATTAVAAESTKNDSSEPVKEEPITPTKRRKASEAPTATPPAAETNDDTNDKTETKKSPKRSPRGSKKKSSEKEDEEVESPKKRQRKSSPKKKTPPSSDNDETSDTEKKSTKKAKKSAADHQNLTECDDIPKLWNDEKAKANGSYTFKIASWNVAGLRALLKKQPDVLSKLAKKHDLDMLCLQETKLQESHLDDPKLKIRGQLLEPDGYDEYYSCSKAKKGYSGTAVFVKRRGEKSSKTKKGSIKSFFQPSKKKGKEPVTNKGDKEKMGSTGNDDLPIPAECLMPQEVCYKIGKTEHDAEGRMIILEYPLFTLCNVYVPNSGQGLVRLDYRTERWDKDFLEFMQQKQKDRGVPVMWLGDLNVAHTNLEVWNDGAKHLPKQAGVTPQERASFQGQLDAGFVDAFRHLHPEAKGHYSYWSTRAGNRITNRGLRLDYFICGPAFFEESSKVIVRDSYMLQEQEGSDHCPVVVEIEIKP